MYTIDTARFFGPPSPRRAGRELLFAATCGVCALLASRAVQGRATLHWAVIAHADTVAQSSLFPTKKPAFSLDLERAHRTSAIG